MIKRDIVRMLYERHGGMTVNEAENHATALLEIMLTAFQKDEDLTITHFGKFRRKKKPVRDVVLPTGETVMSHSGDRIQFLPSPKLKAYINADGISSDEPSAD